jgi:hypothetical protein
MAVSPMQPSVQKKCGKTEETSLEFADVYEEAEGFASTS